METFVRRVSTVPEAQALTWIQQVLDAVSYLHRNHVIHRDIKPSNIKITPSGEAVLVDFGIAKRFVAGQQTMAGAQGFGTSGFASPEHYQGGTDARSDIYSLGATLYNLLTGRVPTDSLGLANGSAVLVAPRTLNPNVSAPTEQVVLRAMSSQPTQRFQNVDEMRVSLFPPKIESVTTRPIPTDTNRIFQYATVGIGLLTIGLLLWMLSALLGWMNTTNNQLGEMRVAMNTATPAPTLLPTQTSTPTRTATRTPTITSTPVPPPPTPSGQIAYESNGTIYIMNADGTEPKKIRDNAHYPAWSPDGSEIAFWTDDNYLHTINTDGSNDVSLDFRNDTQGRLSWATFGLIAATHRRCCYSPEEVRVSFVITFAKDRIFDMTERGLVQPSLSQDNRSLVFINGNDSNRIYLSNADGSNVQLLTTGLNNAHPLWSPDSKRIAFQSNREGNSEIYVIDADGTNLKRLTNNNVDDEYPTWSPDGNFIAFHSKRENRLGIYVMRADGTDEHRISDDSINAANPAWSPQ